MLQDQSRNRTPMPATQPPAGAAPTEPGPARAEAGIAQMLTSALSGGHAARSDVSDDLRVALDELAAADAAGWAETNDDDEAFDVHAARQDAADDAVLATPCRSLADVGAKLTCLIPRIRPDLLNKRHAEHLDAMRSDIGRMLAAEAGCDAYSSDPIMAAIEAWRVRNAALKAFDAQVRAGTFVGDRLAEEDRLVAESSPARDAVLATVPTTAAGRAALVQFVRDEIAASGMANGGPPDDGHPIWRDGLRALLAAQVAELRADNGVMHPDAAFMALAPKLLQMLDEYDRLWAASQEAYDRAAAALGGEPHYDVVGRDAAEDWHRRFVASPGYAAYVKIRRPADALGDRIEAMIAAHMEAPARALDGLLLKQRIGRSLEHYGHVAAEDLDRLVSAADGPGEVAATSTATGSETGAAILAAAEGASPALVAMVEEWQTLLDQINRGGLSDAAVERLGLRHDELQREVYNFPAGSIADLLAKVPVFRDELYDATGSLDDGCKVEDTFSGAAWLGLFRDFERLAHNARLPTAQTAELSELVERFTAVSRERQAADDALATIYDAIAASEPSRPDAMRRSGGFRHFWGLAANKESPEFYTAAEVEYLRANPVSGHCDQRSADAARARVGEIATAYDEWVAACEANDAAHGLPEAEMRWEAANAARREVEREIRSAVPRTAIDLAALAIFARQIQAEFGSEHREGGLLVEAILAVTGEPTAGPPQIHAPLFEQIIACWREWAAQPDGDESDEGEARYDRLTIQRDSLLDAAEAMPATLKNVPAKALASAWLEYVAVWTNGQIREDYGIDGRLALDIDTAITGRTKTHYSGEVA